MTTKFRAGDIVKDNTGKLAQIAAVSPNGEYLTIVGWFGDYSESFRFKLQTAASDEDHERAAMRTIKDHPGSVRASWATEELRKLRVKAKP